MIINYIQLTFMIVLFQLVPIINRYAKGRAIAFRKHLKANNKSNLPPRYSPHSPTGILTSLRASHSRRPKHVPPKPRPYSSSAQRHLRSSSTINRSGEFFRGESGGLQWGRIFVDEAGGEMGQLLPLPAQLQKRQIHPCWYSATGRDGHFSFRGAG